MARKYPFKMIERLKSLGLSEDEARAIRKSAMALASWNLLECGESDGTTSRIIQRDRAGYPWLISTNQQGESTKTQIYDKEATALKRVFDILAKHPNIGYVHECDPRGPSLYLFDLHVARDIPLDEQCTSCGIAVYDYD